VLVTDSGLLAALCIYAHLKWSPELEEQSIGNKNEVYYCPHSRWFSLSGNYILCATSSKRWPLPHSDSSWMYTLLHRRLLEILSVPFYEKAVDVRRIQIKATSCGSTQKTARIFFAVSLGLMYPGWIYLSLIYW